MKIMLVGTHQRIAEADYLVIEISNTRLERVNKFKYLGVLLDNTLSWKDHMEYIGKNNISSRLGFLLRVHKVLPKPTCLMLYNTIVLPLREATWSSGLGCWIWILEVPGSNPPPYYYLDLFSVVLSSTPRLRCVNNQLVSLPPVGILNSLCCIYNICLAQQC